MSQINTDCPIHTVIPHNPSTIVSPHMHSTSRLACALERPNRHGHGSLVQPGEGEGGPVRVQPRQVSFAEAVVDEGAVEAPGQAGEVAEHGAEAAEGLGRGRGIDYVM